MSLSRQRSDPDPRRGGYFKDYSIERFYRDVKLCEIGEGTSEIQRMVIAKQLGLGG